MKQQFIDNLQRDIEYREPKSSIQYKIPVNNNQIFGLEAFRFAGVWAFDNEELGLKNELFVGGADTFIDLVVGPDVDRVGIQFSSKPFPTYQMKVDFTDGEANSGTYYVSESGHELWLCGVLGLYFTEAPKTIYLSFKPIKNA